MKKLSSYLTLLTLTAFALTAAFTGCGAPSPSASSAALDSSSAAALSSGALAEAPKISENGSVSAPESSAASNEDQAQNETNSDPAAGAIRVGSLKGPTSIGLVSLMNTDSSANSYDFTMVTGADELTALIASGKLDIALIPANAASILYNKTEGGVSVIDINTLGVLYLVSSDESIKSTADLKGKTIYLTGKGTTPDYVLRYLLKESGLTENSGAKDSVTLEYKSEPAEVAAILKEKEEAVGLLPQPFVTVAAAQNESLKIVLDLTKEWDRFQGSGGSQLVTGVTIVRNEFLEEQEDKVRVFLADHQVSAGEALANPDKTAGQIVKAGIIEKAPIAKKALPYCNITFIDGEEMKAALSGYLAVLHGQDPKSVGGALPADDFYYIAK